MNVNDGTSAPLARALYDGYPGNEYLDVDPDVHLASLKTLYEHVTFGDGSGDGLFRFLVVEAFEGSKTSDGEMDLEQVIRCLDLAESNLAATRVAVQDLQQRTQKGQD